MVCVFYICIMSESRLFQGVDLSLKSQLPPDGISLFTTLAYLPSGTIILLMAFVFLKFFRF